MEMECEEHCALPRDETEFKKKKKSEVFLQLPPSSIVGIDPLIVEELQSAYEILQTIMKISKIEPFLVKPNADLYGMSNYYNIIKKPMWLNEVHRKLMDREYGGIKEVVSDLKLLLENCYRYWGPSHRFTKKGLNIEHKLEQKLEELPKSLMKCLDTDDCSASAVVKTENDIDTFSNETDRKNLQMPFTAKAPPREPEDSDLLVGSKGFISKILPRVLAEDYSPDRNGEEHLKREEEMLCWERESLVDEETAFLIKHTPQLAEIGHFLRLTSGALNVEEVTQYEVERMLLMPKESTSLATHMTSMLSVCLVNMMVLYFSPAVLRSNLDVTPVMPYEVWTAKLKKRIEDWLKVYYQTDAIEALSINGIEPYFWEVISLVNPLEEKKFHEIGFYQRVWIVKSLCDNLLHTNKTIQDVFMDETRANDFRALDFGKGPSGNYYFGFELLPEIRVYKQKKVLNKFWLTWRKPELGQLKLWRSTFIEKWNEEEKKVELLPNSKNFSIEADSINSLLNLIENFENKGFTRLANALSIYLKEAKMHSNRSEGLEALYRQWHDYKSRAPEYFTNLLNLWLSTENPVYPLKEGDEQSSALGKRRNASKTHVIEECMTDSDNFEEPVVSDEVSDWEEEAGRSKRKKNAAATNKKNKRKSSITEEETDAINNIRRSSLPDIKPEVPTELPPVTPPPVTPPPVTPLPVTLEIKKEEAEDVVVISSDDEDGNPEPKPITPIKPVPVVDASPSSVKTLSVGTKLNSSVTIYKVTPSTPPPPPAPQEVPIRNLPPNIEIVTAPVVMPKPMPEKVRTPRKKVYPMPIQEPPPPLMVNRNMSPLRTPPKGAYGWTQNSPSPRNRTPLSMVGRLRTPPNGSPRMMMPSPGGMMNRSPMMNMRASSTASMVQRNLFPSPNAQQVPTIEGHIVVGQKSDGSYGYHIKLPDGGIIDMSREDVENLRQKHNGQIPNIVRVPLVRNSSRVVY